MDLFQNLFIKAEEDSNSEMYLKYIETIQNKFISIIEEKNLKIESLEKEKNLYYTKYVDTQECLEVQLSTNNNLLKIIKEKEDESKNPHSFKFKIN